MRKQMLKTEVAFHAPVKLCPLPPNHAGCKAPSAISSPPPCTKQVQAVSSQAFGTYWMAAALPF